ncbi:SusC/RagA family TonB-linked outer membrane protein [Chitinophaga sp. SYP-B3965]|uniref:SusC/RagA family TonB-linked outer membrane protein n=1 Tax=Chitinophaga sp. SYP-B3965 TaxID=2663120 RepID=UPI00129970C5|nr:TonB-dependent receptor [Chitinophaga sp. SYP-B3965]MRG45196.1 SusC/RagA family TonB-linked outer membrane protein [Chitinophaga sp. SYP-B3965]
MKSSIYHLFTRPARQRFVALAFTCCAGLNASAQTVRTDSAEIAYGRQPAWMVTGAVSSVVGSDLKKTFNTNLGNTLYGRLPGLTVQPGSSENGGNTPGLLIRGVNTFGGAGTKILILVDGFESSFAQLVPDEVATITILKDAAATALYGSRGANGVMLVTTKKGEQGMLKVGFGVQFGINKPVALPKNLRSYDHASLYNEALQNDGKIPIYSTADLDAYKNGNDPYFHPDVNWYDQIIRKSAPMANYNLTFNGGNETVRYFVALNALTSQGLLIKAGDEEEESSNSKYQRYNFRTNVDINVTKRLTAAIRLGGSVEDNANPVGNSTASVFQLASAIPSNAFPVRLPDGSFGGNALFANPLGNILQTGSYTANGRTLQGSLRLTQQLDFITKGLSLSGVLAMNSYFNSYSNKSKQYERFSITRNSNGDTLITRFGQKTSLAGDESRSDQWRNYALQGFLNYDRTFGVHNISAMLMYNQDSYSVSGDGMPYKHINGGARVTYAYDERYVAEVNMSYMGSENFVKGKRFGYFPAVSAGWIASNENFMKESKVITYLKVRGSYGLTGNDLIGGQRFMFDQLFPFTASPYFGTGNTGTAGLAEGTPANPNVTWEKETKMNVGLEASFIDRITLSLDVFNNKRRDILSQPFFTVPQYVGVDLPLLNVGKVDNKGFEAVIGYHNAPEANVQWFAQGSASYAKNNITYNAEAVQVDTYLYRTGTAVGQPFGLEAIGFFQDVADINASPRHTFTTVQPGDIKYKDQNGDNKIDQNDVTAIGKTYLPTLTYSLHAGVKYKGFDLDAFFQGVSGSTASLGAQFYAFQNNGSAPEMAKDRWTPATAATATYPRLSSDNNLNNYRYSSFWLRDGSYLKLRSLELGYSLPKQTLSKARLNLARVYISGNNLFSVDDIEGDLDPEAMGTGYPALRTFSAGFRVEF